MAGVMLIVMLWTPPALADFEPEHHVVPGFVGNPWTRADEVFIERVGKNPGVMINPFALMGEEMLAGARVLNESVLGPVLSWLPVIWLPMAVDEGMNAIDMVTPGDGGFYKKTLGAGVKSLAHDMGQWLAKAVTIIQQTLDGLRQKAHRLDGAGQNLMALLTLVAVILAGLNWLLDGDLEDVIKGGFEIILVTGLALWFLRSYGDVMEQGLIGGFDALGRQMAQGFGPKAQGLLDAAGEHSPLYRIGQALALQIGAVWDTGVSGNSRNWGVSLASILTIMALLLAMILFFIHYVHILVRLSIAHIVAPIFIACLPLKQTRFLFEGWLHYIIACGLSLMLLYLMVSLGTAILSGLPDPGGQTSGTLNLSAAMLVLVLAMTTARLARSAEAVATGILHGHPEAWAGAAAAAWAATGGRMARMGRAAQQSAAKQQKENQKKQANKKRGSRR
jgi:type IV secretory pathway TrbL component